MIKSLSNVITYLLTIRHFSLNILKCLLRPPAEVVIPAFDVRAWLNLIGPARPKNITRLLVNEVIKDKQHGGYCREMRGQP